MPKTVTLTMRTCWRVAEEATGKECVACGDAIWWQGYGCYVIIGRPSRESTILSDLFLCGSCGEDKPHD